MVFKNSKVIKYFALFVFLVFNIKGVSTSNSTKFDFIKNEIKTKEKKKISTPKYPKELTIKVSEKLDSVFKRFNKRHDFHGSVLVAKNGKLIFSNHYGYANFSKKLKLDNNSTFQLASVSKQFTAASILILFEKGLLKLDDKVSKYYPDFPYEDVTIRHLLNHTSGLPQYFWLAEHEWKKEIPPVNAEMMDMMSEYKVLRYFKPGSRFDYSNTGYFVLASLVEKISNESYRDFVEKNIFKPLDMNNSYVYRYKQDKIEDDQLYGYRLHRGWKHIKITGTVNDAITGDKNVYSTVEDLFKWINGLNSGKIISENTLNEMYSKGETKYGKKVPYGFGFRIDDKDDEKVIYHYGKWNGFSTSIKQYTDSDITIITLEHSNYRSMNHLNETVKNIVIDNFDENAEL